MSNDLAIATVTETLRSVLHGEVKDRVSQAQATAMRPDDATGFAPCVNVFLYQVTPNAAQRNRDLPTRDSNGALLRRPTVALDLHYLLTVHGSDVKFEAQRLLGIVVRALHVQPILSRQAITDAISAANDDLLAESNLADAPEPVRFTPEPLTLDDVSKLWSTFLPAKYAVSVGYQASVVLIEGEQRETAPLPVKTHSVVVVPSLGPVIDRVASRPAASTAPPQARPILIDHVLHIIGRGLGSPDTTRVRINDEDFAPATADDALVTIDLKIPPLSSLRVGVTTVQIVQEVDFGGASGKHDAFASNAVPFILAPLVTSPSRVGDDVLVTVDPPLDAGLTLVLLLNRITGSPLAMRFDGTSVAGAAQKIKATSIPPGTYLVRLQVEGAESPLSLDASGHYDGPKVMV